MREQRMNANEYEVAVMLWNYARQVKSEIDEAVRRGSMVLDFQKIAVPHSRGYKVSIELAGTSFKVFAVPEQYNKTGRLSFFADSSITVRACDRAGDQATEQDSEYTGDDSAKD